MYTTFLIINEILCIIYGIGFVLNPESFEQYARRKVTFQDIDLLNGNYRIRINVTFWFEMS